MLDVEDRTTQETVQLVCRTTSDVHLPDLAANSTVVHVNTPSTTVNLTSGPHPGCPEVKCENSDESTVVVIVAVVFAAIVALGAAFLAVSAMNALKSKASGPATSV